MHSIGKYKLYMSVGLSVLIIILTLVLLAISKEAAVISILLSMVILLAIMAVFINYLALKKLRRAVDNLPDSYQEVYVDAQEVIALSSISTQEKKELKEMVLEIFEHAALDQRDVNDVIGNDLKGFLDPFIRTAGGQTSFLYLFAYGGFLFMAYLIAMKLYKVIRPGFAMENFKTETLDLGITMTYFLIAFIFFPWLILTLKKAANEQWTGLKRLRTLMPFIIPIGLMFFLITIRVPSLVKIIDLQVPIFSSVYLLMLGVLIGMGFFILMIYAKHKNRQF